MDLNLRDKVAIVTGGSRGLGRAISLGLAAEGVKVAVQYLRDVKAGIDLSAEAVELVKVIRAAHGVRAIPVAGDVSQADDVAELFRLTEAELGPVDILVNNAGVWPTAYVRDMNEADWRRTMDVNLLGPFLTCREAVRRWLDAGRTGRIVNITSQAAFHGSTTGHAHYAASKAGLVTFSISLAREVAPNGIHVNCVAPGMMATEMAREALDKGQEEYLKRIPLRRIAEAAGGGQRGGVPGVGPGELHDRHDVGRHRRDVDAIGRPERPQCISRRLLCERQNLVRSMQNVKCKLQNAN